MYKSKCCFQCFTSQVSNLLWNSRIWHDREEVFQALKQSGKVRVRLCVGFGC